MRNILLTISYDGTDFCGWQRQASSETQINGVRTVQGEIEKALSQIHKTPTKLQGSGRTDSGVHARGQTASFFSPIDSIECQNYIPALNSLLPYDIRILNAIEVSANFNARFSAKSRTYRYFINCKQTPFAEELRYSWSIRRLPNIEKLNEMAICLIGEQNFTTFTSSLDASTSKSRYIFNAHFYWQIENEILVFEITANAFLWKMVRSITGTLIEFEKKGLDATAFSSALHAKDRKKAGVTAPPQGLFLWQVSY